ncbi:MAG: helix-turn-helix domain-containing protein [Nitrosomonadales bacterium]|nr:helix-turn-helix domain-containing protein [Nitrosomonadales bacterium]
MMEQLSANDPEHSDLAPDNAAVSGGGASLGKTLREARERLGLSVADVAEQIKLAPRQIEALEADDFEHLPETAFVRGFVRSYAKLLKLDAQVILATLAPARQVSGGMAPTPVEVPFPDPQLTQRKNLAWSGLALLLAVLVVVFATRSCNKAPVQEKVARVETPVALPAEAQVVPDAGSAKPDMAVPPESVAVPVASKEKLPETAVQSVPKAPKPVVAPPTRQTQSAAPATQPDVPTQSGPVQSGLLRFEFDAESWVEIKDRDGNILRSQAFQPGRNLRVAGNPPFSLLIGNASSVRLYYRDKQVDLAPHTRSSTDVAHLTLE